MGSRFKIANFEAAFLAVFLNHRMEMLGNWCLKHK